MSLANILGYGLSGSFIIIWNFKQILNFKKVSNQQKIFWLDLVLDFILFFKYKKIEQDSERVETNLLKWNWLFVI